MPTAVPIVEPNSRKRSVLHGPHVSSPQDSSDHRFFTKRPQPRRTGGSPINQTRTDSSPCSINATPPNSHDGAWVADPPAPAACSRSAVVRDANHARRHGGVSGSPRWRRFFGSPWPPSRQRLARQRRNSATPNSASNSQALNFQNDQAKKANGRSMLGGVIAARTDGERATPHATRKGGLLRGDEREGHSLCLAKKAVAFS